MRPIRLLPIVIFAALALLVFKGIGLVTNGGYVLTGPVAVVAQEGGGGEAEMSLASPSDATMTDTSPMLADTQPTIAAKVDSASEPSSSASSSAMASSMAASGEPNASSSVPPASSSVDPKSATVCPESTTTKPTTAGAHELTDKIGTALAQGCPTSQIPVNAHGDAMPSIKNGAGKIVPLEVAEGDDSQTALLQRLGDRRADLDKREADLQMRESLVAAAEKKLDERTQELGVLQAQVATLVDEKQAAEDASFKAIVSMYENMKPKDAAKIFDTLELNVLLKVARAMNPRKMSPVLAAMAPEPAQALTTAFASTENTDTVVAAANSGGSQNLAALPQIVGH